MPKLLLYYTTFATQDDAQDLIKKLLERRLVLCANIFQIESHYVWKGIPTHGTETACYLKVDFACLEAFEHYFMAHHPYETPCFFQIEVNNKSPCFIKSLINS